MKACNVEKREEGNWCLDHQRFHDGHLYDISQQLTPLAQSYRDLWSGNVKPKRLLRSLPMAKQCINLGTQNPPEKAGCGSCVTWNCAIKGKVKLAHCTEECGDWKKKESEPGEMSFDPIRFDHFNLHPEAIPGVRFNSSIIESI